MKAAYEGYSFQLNKRINRTKVKFRNRYGIELAGDLYAPSNTSGKLPAIAVAGPFGAVKEQAAGLYADEMASRGFIALAFDPSFIGEVRNVASPDINTEDFSAAVDFLSVQDNIEPEKIGSTDEHFRDMAEHACRNEAIKGVKTLTPDDVVRYIRCVYK